MKLTRTTADTGFSAASLSTTVKTAQQKSCSPDRFAEGIRSSVCVEGSRPARSCGMAAGGVRENPELCGVSSAEAPIGVQTGAGTKVLATPQAAARSAVRSVPVTFIILPVALPGSPQQRCARSLCLTDAVCGKRLATMPPTCIISAELVLVEKAPRTSNDPARIHGVRYFATYEFKKTSSSCFSS